MKQPTYKEQFDKLTEAYIHNKVEPYTACACFVGNLLNRTSNWISGRGMAAGETMEDWNIKHPRAPLSQELVEKATYVSQQSITENSGGLYTLREIIDLEKVFLDALEGNCSEDDNSYEEYLFKAFELTLAKLKEIHESKGEIVDAPPVFIKRQLVTS